MKNILLLLLVAQTCVGANIEEQSQYVQDIRVPGKGFYQFDLSKDVLEKSQAGLRDLRLLDSDQKETAYWITTPTFLDSRVIEADTVDTKWQDGETVVHIKTKIDQLVTEINLEVLSEEFRRSAQLEVFRDGAWVNLLDHYPFYRQNHPYVSQTSFTFPPVKAREFRVKIPDVKESPVIVKKAFLRLPEKENIQTVACPVEILDHIVSAGKSYHSIRLKSSVFLNHGFFFDVEDPVFQRTLKVTVPLIEGNSIREDTILTSGLVRYAGQNNKDSKIEVTTYHGKFSSKECSVYPSSFNEFRIYIENADDSPLKIRSIEAKVSPISCVFYAPQAGNYRLFTGNPKSEKPSYDLTELKKADPKKIEINAALAANPHCKKESFVPEKEILGATLTPSDWKYHFSFSQKEVGVQEVELPLQVLSKTDENLSDLRVVRGDVQIPYLVERIMLHRSANTKVEIANDPSRKKISRWKIELPYENASIREIVLQSPTQSFERTFSIYEDTRENGKMFLGSNFWRHQPEKSKESCVIALRRAPRSKTLWIETDNGDNAPIDLSKVEYRYPIVRILYYISSNEPSQLLVGNSSVGSPSYETASLEKKLESSPRIKINAADVKEGNASFSFKSWFIGGGSVLYWVILAGVVAGLFFVMAKLLPAQSKQ